MTELIPTADQTDLQPYVLIQDLPNLIQPESIVSRTVYTDQHIKVVLFGFDKGQSLSEHTASQSATIQIVQGEATITFGEDRQEVQSGAWIHMQSGLVHSVVAKTPMIMILTLIKGK